MLYCRFPIAARKLLPALARGNRLLWCSASFRKKHATLHAILKHLVCGKKWRWDNTGVKPTMAFVAESDPAVVPAKCAIVTAENMGSCKFLWGVDHAKPLHGMCGR